MRDDFLPTIKDLLAKRVGYRCSNPDCRQATSGPHADPTKVVNVGVASHITAASPDGPRYDSSLSPEQRKSQANGIWLCQKCGKLVDNDAVRYTVEKLLEWKKTAEETAIREVEGSKRAGMPSIPNDRSNPENSVDSVVWRTLLDLQAIHSPVSIGMLINTVESLEFLYIRAVTIIPVLQGMRLRGQLTWDRKDVYDLNRDAILRVNPAWKWVNEVVNRFEVKGAQVVQGAA